MARNDAVVRVHFRLLAKQHVFRLRFGDFDFCFQFPRLRDARQIGAGGHLLSHVHLQQLHDAVNPCANVQGFHLALLQMEERLELVNFRLLRGELRLGVFRIDAQPLLLDLVARRERASFGRGQFCGEFGSEALLG